LGVVREKKGIQRLQGGVFFIEEENLDLLFVTLKKIRGGLLADDNVSRGGSVTRCRGTCTRRRRWRQVRSQALTKAWLPGLR
jgi:hypothetical protein